ncbi:hypothetical protein K432DRAFT_428779 [Lepidopterella palustris CBS 459.81]|uniref:Uncharacterized protein n=1 Tax=Lepidopterella palustris CBS 459.81 TaxID=1314670 RepID=A0A8E2JBJ4_9PEZI|nr:hypothetical protein K432DRAFT_428779 [Lepidopterella palustris CBS 459.81]
MATMVPTIWEQSSVRNTISPGSAEIQATAPARQVPATDPYGSAEIQATAPARQVPATDPYGSADAQNFNAQTRHTASSSGAAQPSPNHIVVSQMTPFRPQPGSRRLATCSRTLEICSFGGSGPDIGVVLMELIGTKFYKDLEEARAKRATKDTAKGKGKGKRGRPRKNPEPEADVDAGKVKLSRKRKNPAPEAEAEAEAEIEAEAGSSVHKVARMSEVELPGAPWMSEVEPAKAQEAPFRAPVARMY